MKLIALGEFLKNLVPLTIVARALFPVPGVAIAENIVFPGNANVINVKDYGAEGDGYSDDTEEIQNALNAAADNRIVYFPNGTYLVSNQLKFKEWQQNGKWKSNRTIVQGQSRDGTTIRLANNVGAKTVLYCGQGDYAQSFRNAVRNITIHTGSGNSGATGLKFIASNAGRINKVKIVDGASNGAVGLDVSYEPRMGNFLVDELEVVGFDVGIETYHNYYGMVFEHITFRNQRSYGIKNRGNMVAMRDVTSYNSVPVILNNTESGGDATFVLVDANLSGSASGNSAIINQSTMWVRNVTQSGYGKTIDNQSGSGSDQSGTFVDEWSSHAVEKLWSNSINRSLSLPVKTTPAVPWDNLSDWGRWDAFGGSTDTERLQNAVDGGKSTVYIPNGDMPVIEGTVYIRGNVRRIIGCEGRIKGTGTLTFTGGTQDTVIIERIEGKAQGSWAPDIIHDCAKTLIIESCWFPKVTGTGTGDLFINDFSSSNWRQLQSGCALELTNSAQSCWIRNFNPEDRWESNIINHGSKLWALFIKSESGDSYLVETRNGGWTEVLGLHTLTYHYNNGNPALFRSVDSRSTFAGVMVKQSNSEKYQEYLLEETRGGTTQRLSNPSGNCTATALLSASTEMAEHGNSYPSFLTTSPSDTSEGSMRNIDTYELPGIAYPSNPTDGVLTLEMGTASDVKIMDLTGRCVYCSWLTEGINTINISGLNSGIYFFQSNNAGYKIVKH